MALYEKGIEMILIAHRGNLNGKQPERENSPEYIKKALEEGYHVEVDIWLKETNNLFLGHDGPKYPIGLQFLKDDRIWCHCKNIDALGYLLDKGVHCFFHKTDDVILTSKGYIWTFPNKRLLPGSFCVMPEYGYNGDLSKCAGICSDFIEDYKQ